ncbi:MAG: hypothetical protein QOI64_1291 [Solirubrobacteraceae bacterium]|nr:hypothetical protein [Solirubrobacteraceae bacterium]
MDYAADEQVIYEGHPSWRSILAFYIMGVVLVAVAAAIGLFASGGTLAAGLGAGAFLLLLIVGWLKRISTRYSITDRRLRIQRGILSRKTEEARVERVQNVSVSQSLLGRILRVGTVDFDTASNRPDDLFQFRGIASPNNVVNLVDQAQHAQTGRAQAQAPPQTQPPPPPPPPPPSDEPAV